MGEGPGGTLAQVLGAAVVGEGRAPWRGLQCSRGEGRVELAVLLGLVLVPLLVDLVRHHSGGVGVGEE